MDILMQINPFDELFDTVGAVAYLNEHGDPSTKTTHKTKATYSRINLVKNYPHIGRLLNARCRVYLKKELDAFIAGEDYTPDPDYESAIFDPLMTAREAADALGISYALMLKIMSHNKIQYEKRGGTALFIQQHLDQYREEHTS